jgi:hypothetical protein
VKTYAAGFLLLLIWTGSGIVKHGGEYDSMDDCRAAWDGIKMCEQKRAVKAKKGDCFFECGQFIGFCVEAERLVAPGAVFPFAKDDSNYCD